MLLNKVNADKSLTGQLKALSPRNASPVMSTPTLTRVIAQVAKATRQTRAAG